MIEPVHKSLDEAGRTHIPCERIAAMAFDMAEAMIAEELRREG